MDTHLDLSQRGLRAVVVDDNEHMRVLLRSLPQRIGIESTEYGDGNAALIAISDFKPQLVLTDMAMKPMDGLALVHALRRLPDQQVQTTPVIMITGHADRHVVQSARDCGVNELLVKPITERALHQRVQEVILRPRPFIFGPDYFGPCRHRHGNRDYAGPERRATTKSLAE
jgi:two-component system, chemotaxis family, chemotaxis protein CheY